MAHHTPHASSSAKSFLRRIDWSAHRKGLIAVVVVVIAVAALVHFTEFEWAQVSEVLANVNRPLALLVMAILPIVGFPISAVYLGAGAMFGPWLGGLVVAGVTVIHVVVTHLLARTVLRRLVERWRGKWLRKLPEVPKEETATLVAMIVIVPGLPYFARNCLLAFTGVPFAYLLGVGVPLYVARSYVTIFLGNLGSDPSPRALAILGAVFVVKLGISALLFRRLKQRVRLRRR